jgi:hypothetical protein
MIDANNLPAVAYIASHVRIVAGLPLIAVKPTGELVYSTSEGIRSPWGFYGAGCNCYSLSEAFYTGHEAAAYAADYLRRHVAALKAKHDAKMRKLETAAAAFEALAQVKA